ncbi:3-deoxy-D-manno-octulosonic-acid transferase [Shimia isoporae]|uniref:3-deoxy-D-manno-octulosonic acid transferase n=1 Tax=Shimia isoporae TaxID=647720 RepID=A0A4V2Q428_9RHOB|nr:glycosyltransferase N-terminal domain-containing protein [Shimia isoporae]TCL09470.1 3-deoxy-D-manno-octulosonic-acid transferase [Shimia isoporae]
MALLVYRCATRALPLVAPSLLRKRLKHGKEDASRWREKLGEPTAPRPEGRLVWLHAVGLGEVLALRGLIDAMSAQNPDLHFLVTSTARSSAQVMGGNLPPKSTHQFLPLDAPRYLHQFLDHWQPDLSVWSEQDLWPNAVSLAHKRGIPVALINARITDTSLDKRRLGRALYSAMFCRMSLIAAQEDRTARNLQALGAKNVRVTGSLKSAAPPLAFDSHELKAAQNLLQGRKVWVAASTHAGDEAAALAAQNVLRRKDPSQLLVLVPRDSSRMRSIMQNFENMSLSASVRSLNETVKDETDVYIADTYGELGLWYRLCDRALIGGGFDDIGGHNPWEAASLDCAILHGPDTLNFATDYTQLDEARAALATTADNLPADLMRGDLRNFAENAKALSDDARNSLAPLANDLCALLERPKT